MQTYRTGQKNQVVDLPQKEINPHTARKNSKVAATDSRFAEKAAFVISSWISKKR